MPLTVTVTKKESGIFTVSPAGSIDSETYMELEKEIRTIMDSSPKGIILNLEGVTFISSMGLRTIFMAREMMEEKKGTLVIANPQPKIKEMFDIVKVIPDSMFASLEEADEYLDAFLSEIEKEGS